MCVIVGYTRKSTAKEGQKFDRQETAIQDYAKTNNFTVLEWYHDTISGKTKAETRPGYQLLKSKLKPGDILLVSDLDRLGRDPDDTIIEVKDLQARGVKLIALDVPYLNEWGNKDNDSLHRMIIDILITLKAHIAQQEREKTVARIKQGLKVAKNKGKKLGRPQLALSQNFIKKYEDFLAGAYGKMDNTGFAKMMGIHRTTLYKYIDVYNRLLPDKNSL